MGQQLWLTFCSACIQMFFTNIYFPSLTGECSYMISISKTPCIVKQPMLSEAHVADDSNSMKCSFAFAQIASNWLLQNFVHAMTAQLSWHVQKFITIRLPTIWLEQWLPLDLNFTWNIISVMEIWPGNHWVGGTWRGNVVIAWCYQTTCIHGLGVISAHYCDFQC